MMEIKENQKLKLNNLLSYRGRILQSELKSIGRDMELKINERGAKITAYPIMATYGIDGEFGIAAAVVNPEPVSKIYAFINGGNF